MPLEGSMRLGFYFGYMRMSLSNDKINTELLNEGVGGTADVSGHVAAMPLVLGLSFMPSRPGFKPYGLIEAGIVMYSKDYKGGTYVYPAGDVITLPGESEFRVEPALNFGIGFLAPLQQDLSLDVTLRYHLVKNSQYASVEPTPDGYSGVGQFISVAAGVAYFY